MSIVGTLRYYDRPFSQDPSPGTPGGMWQIVGSVTGDASGGKRQLNWNVAGVANITGRYFSLDALELVTDSADINASLTIRGMDPTPFPDLGSFTRHYHLQMQAITNAVGFTASAPTLGGTTANPHLFLGRPSQDPVVTNQLSFDIINSDGNEWFVHGQGFWWWPLATNAIGGFRRPPDGLWRM